MTLLDAKISKPMEGGPSFSLGNRLIRVLWGMAWLLLARWTPPPMHGWRRFILRRFGASIAPGVRIHASVKIWLPANLAVGEKALIGPGARLYNQGSISIGARSVISQGAYLCASSHDISDNNFQLVLRPIIVGENCWVATEAFVGPGISMADGSVLAARAALFESTAENGVYRGNPAALVKQRKLRAN